MTPARTLRQHAEMVIKRHKLLRERDLGKKDECRCEGCELARVILSYCSLGIVINFAETAE